MKLPCLALVAITLLQGAFATPASVTHSAPATVSPGQSFTVYASCSDPDGNLSGMSVRWQGIGLVAWWPSSGYSDNQSVILTAPSSGSFNIRAEALDTDNTGSDSGWQTITVEGHINIQTSITINAASVDFSINDNGVVNGSKAYSNTINSPVFPYYSIIYDVREARGGPGYVTWYEIEARNSSQYPSYNYALHRQMLARYIRSSRSWEIVTLNTLRTGYNSSYMYGWQFPGTLSLTQFTYQTKANYNTPPYNEVTWNRSYAIPKQPL